MIDPTGSSPSRARLYFHLALATIFLPCVGTLVSWLLVLLNVLRVTADPEHAKWARRLQQLVIVDVLVIVAFMMGMRAHSSKLSAPAETHASIGVLLDELSGSGSLSIRELVPDMPAEKAGLQAGDRIVAVDGTPVLDREVTLKDMSEGRPGIARTFTIERGGSRRDVAIVPRTIDLRRLELWTVWSVQPWTAWHFAVEALDYLPFAAIAGFAWFRARRRRTTVPVWRGVVLAVVVTFGASFVASVALALILGGMSWGCVLIILLMQAVLLLVMSVVAEKWSGPVAPSMEPAPLLSPVRGGLLGAYYLLTGYLRVFIPLWAIDVLVFGGQAMGPQTLDMMAEAKLGFVGVALFVLSVVVLVPIAEEMLFRGVLLPRLVVSHGRAWAIGISAAAFGLLHTSYSIYAGLTVFYGVVLAWARLRTGDLAVPIMMHMLINGVASLFMLAR